MVRAGHGSRTPGAAPANIHVKAKLLQTRVAKKAIPTYLNIHVKVKLLQTRVAKEAEQILTTGYIVPLMAPLTAFYSILGRSLTKISKILELILITLNQPHFEIPCDRSSKQCFFFLQLF